MGVAAVKSEQAETRAQRRKHAKSHGMGYEGLRRGSSSDQRGGVELWEETGSFRFATCIFQVQFHFLAGYRGMCVGFSIRYGLRVGLVRKWKLLFPPEVSDGVG